jgi:peptidoglycan/LPS O-acetylase OafA/YrhL
VIIPYKREIDGLRAIAVGAVILYHAQITILGYQPFKGGFIGVDIFFVISGYLISSIILKELITTGSLSFKHFYERRVRRILPALLFVMLISLPFAYLYLLPSSFVDFSKSIIYSLGFSSNIYFWYSGSEYGAESALLKPFLHTWSLSVEEQFYILFPLILLIIFKFFKRKIINFFLISIVISLCLASYTSSIYPSASFYLLFTRVWELLIGSMLAYYKITKGFSKKKGVTLILPSLGMFLILYSIIIFDNQNPAPSFLTLLPVIGCSMVIYFANPNEMITKVLSTKLFVGIGLISYSLYLWHYPVFAYSRIVNFTEDVILKKILLAVIIILLSIFSYYLVEKPFRNKKYKFKLVFFIITVSILILVSFNQIVIQNNGFANRYDQIYEKNNFFNHELKAQSWKFIENENIQKFQSKNKIKILLVGDSHSKDLFNAFIQNKNLFGEYEFLRYGANNKDAIKFDKDLSNKKIDIFKKSQIFKNADIILISDYFDDDGAFSRLDYFLNSLKHKKRIVLTSNSNVYDHGKKYKNLYNLTLFDYFLLKVNKDMKLIDKNLSSSNINKINKFYFQNKKEKKVKKINDKIKQIANKHQIKLLIKQDFQCELIKKICYGITNDGKKIFYDSTHFTLDGAKFFGKKIYELKWLKFD